MKKFTKIILIIAGSLAALGIVFSGIAAVMGAGWSTGSHHCGDTAENNSECG